MEDDTGLRTLAHGPSDPRERQEALRELKLADLQQWVHTFVSGATPARLAAEAQRLRHLYNDDDLRRIIAALKKELAPLKRRRRTTERVAWDTPDGIVAANEIKALRESHQLSQIDACSLWQEQSREMPSRRGCYLVEGLDAESLRKQVFGRVRDKLP